MTLKMLSENPHHTAKSIPQNILILLQLFAALRFSQRDRALPRLFHMPALVLLAPAAWMAQCGAKFQGSRNLPPDTRD